MREVWKKEAKSLFKASGKAIIDRFDRIIAKEGDGGGLTHVVGILDYFNESSSRKYAAILMDHLPPRLIHSFAIMITANGSIHRNYLHSLCILGYGNLGGKVICDQLCHGVDSQSHLEDYLSYLDADEVQEFLSLAVTLLGKSPADACQILRDEPCFPDDYLDGENTNEILSASNIAKLVVKVCFIREVEVPSEIKDIHIKQFFAYLCEEFSSKNLHTSDFLSMTRVAIKRYQLNIDVAINYFKDRILEAAVCLAQEAGRPKPTPSPDCAVYATRAPFINPPCDDCHTRTGHGLSDVGQSYLLSSSSLEIFSLELQNSECIAMMHHEPPMLIPTPSAMDLLSIRTANHFFHLLIDQSPTYAKDAIFEEEAKLAEMQKKRKEAEEARRLREKEIAENERQLFEEQRQREEKIAEDDRRLKEQQRALEDERRQLAEERERERERQLEDSRYPRDRYHAMEREEGKGKRSGQSGHSSSHSSDRRPGDLKRSRR